jgi:single-stranded-DNA-specific exonuclease
MPANKILNIASTHAHLQDTLSKELHISGILAQVLVNRGINSLKEAEKFLNVDLNHLLDPHDFADMSKAVEIIKKAGSRRQRVMIFGDYDVDGVTAVALLKSALSKVGIDADHYIPHRIKEGYGLSKNILNIVRNKNIKLLITVDCGTNSHEQIKELRRHNIEVIITDHHEPTEPFKSPASALINPKLKNCGYKYRDLAGVGVAYKLTQAITGEKLFDDLDLVSLGTITDIVPLTGENRIITKEGLRRICQTKNLGLKALIESSGIKDKRITPHFVSYILGPRLNASGRMEHADISLNLLMSNDEAEVSRLAKVLEGYNRQRQKIEEKILSEAEALIDKEVNFKEHKVIVIAKEDWHQGVIGIVASKLAERFYRPTILISLTEDLCKGSGRSIKNFHLFHALLECKEFLETFGGHSHAVGLMITKDNIEDFKQTINRLAHEKLLLEDLLPSLNIDMELSLSDLDEKIITELEALEPFGAGNPEPLFYSRSLKLRGEPLVLGRATLKFWVTDGEVTYQAIGFGMGNFKDSLNQADAFDLIYTPRLDNWGGEEKILLEIKDIFFR